MRKPTTVFFIAIISLLLFSGTIAPTHTQAISSGSPPAAPAVAGCWSVVYSPNVGTVDNQLEGVAAISSSDIWAVGFYRVIGGANNTLVEHWNGTTWSVVPSPSPGTSENYLFGVTAISPSDVWAVGFYANASGSSGSQTLTEHWNGSSWSVVPSPSPGTPNNILWGVTAISPSDVWAVGYYSNGTLVEHWDGSSWSVVSSPNPGTNYDDLNGVTAVSPSDVWAVGSYANGSVFETLTEHWNGSSWSVVPSPNVGTSINYLYGVTTLSSSDVWAVGDYSNGSVNQTLTEHWNGSSWSVAPSPNPGTSRNYLFGVAATSPSDVWAVGEYSNGSVFETLTEHWNDSSWSVVPSPNAGSGYNGLYGVTAISPSNIWAVGFYFNGSFYQTLVEHYSTSECATPTPGGPTNTPVPLPTATPQPTVCPNPFVDINGSIFFHAINYLYCNGVINGTDPTHYSPAGTSTRGQFAKVVVLGFGTPFYTPATQDFSDVPPGYFAYLYIESGFHAGILSGFDANTCAAHGVAFPCYLPNLPITRGQLTKLVVNAAHYPLTTPTSGPSFSDVPPSNVFYIAIETAHSKGVINGYNDGTFRPNNPIRRDEMAQIVYKGVTTP